MKTWPEHSARILTGILLSTIFFLADAQQKELTVDVLNNRQVNQKTLQNVQWVKGTGNCSWLSDNQLIKASALPAFRHRRDTLLRIRDLNKAMRNLGKDTLRNFPSITWKDAVSFTFTASNQLLSYNLSQSSLTRINQWNDKAQNLDVDAGTGHVAYTVDNNLFVSIDGKEVSLSSETNPGILYGSERVHRNEWGISKGTFWSPRGRKLAFYRMDETMVADYPLIHVDKRIAEVENIKYPMAAEASHQVTVGVYDLQSGKTLYLKTGEPADQFLTNIAWTPDEKYVMIAVLNRAQNHLWLNQYDAATGDLVKTLFEETNARYVEPMDPPVFLKNHPTQFIWQSRRDGYLHLYLYDLSGQLVRQLTRGPWEVTGLLGLDEAEKIAFFMGNRETPLEKQLYAVQLKDGKIRLLSSPGRNHNTMVDPSGNYFIDVSGALDIPLNYVICDKAGKALDTLLKGVNPLKDYRLGKTSLITLKTEEGIPLYARMITPPGFDEKKKYPVVVYVYGGPHSQLVTNTWLGAASLYLNVLASQGYVVFTLDNRGTSNRGFEFESVIHRHLGDLEVRDQMRGVAYLKTLPYIDTTRMAVEGWSYGGFMTISMMLKNPGVFKVGICGGPVIDWKFYEVMYGERYMDTPQENPDGYSGSSLLNLAGNLKGKLLVIHGTIDPTVVWQNTLEFIKKCISSGVQVDYFVYPEHEHGVGGKDRIHLMKKQLQYYSDFL